MTVVYVAIVFYVLILAGLGVYVHLDTRRFLEQSRDTPRWGSDLDWSNLNPEQQRQLEQILQRASRYLPDPDEPEKALKINWKQEGF